jgi:hypothetical protein
METIEYVEDALESITKLILWDNEFSIDQTDISVLHSLNGAVQREGALTRKQAMLVLKILSKYAASPNIGFDLQKIVDNPKWRADFRKIDQTRSVKVEKDEHGNLWFVLKFPYTLLKPFEERIVNDENKNETSWCPDQRVKRLKFYEFNIVSIYEFAQEYDFAIDETFIEALHKVEEIWQQQDNISPYSSVKDNQVVLFNAVPDAQSHFQQHRSGVIEQDLFLAKSMGYIYKIDSQPTSVVEKIAQEAGNHFWLKTNREFLQLYKSIDGIAAIILDRNTENMLEWLQQFILDAVDIGVDTSLFRVCYREPSDSKIPFNSWIKDNGLGGKVDGGKLFFFRHKPAKWLFRDNVDVKLVATNSFTPVHELTTTWWLQSHPCVCYITDIKPTKTRNKRIAHL